jgi:hypothetical protein
LKAVKNLGWEGRGNGRSYMDQNKIYSAGIYWEIPLNIDLEINNERQDGKIDTMWEGKR